MKGNTKCRNGVVWGSYRHSRSLEIAPIDRVHTIEFLLSFHSNYVFAPFLRFNEILAENYRLNLPHPCLAYTLGVRPLEFRLHFGTRKRVPALSYGVDCVIIHLVVLKQYLRVTDRLTDGRTDRWTHDDSIYRANIVSRANNKSRDPDSALSGVFCRQCARTCYRDYTINQVPNSKSLSPSVTKI